MFFHFLICTALALLSLPLANTTPLTLDGGRTLQAREPKGQGSNQAPRREAFIYFGIKDELKDDWSNPNKWPAHSFLWIEGDANNGPVKIEIVLEDQKTGQPTLRYLEFAKGSDAKGPKIGTYKKQFSLGHTNVQNTDLLNQQKNGAGILMDAVNQDATYRVGPTNSNNLNSCHNVLKRIVASADGIQITQDTKDWMTFYDNWTKTKGWDIKSPIRYVRKWAAGATKDDKSSLIKSYPTSSCTGKKLKRDTTCPIPTDDENKAVKPGQLEVAATDKASILPPDALTVDSAEDFSDKAAPPDVLTDSRITIAKVAGELKSYVTLARPALEALGWAGSAVGAAFVIIDLVDSKWVGAAVGGIGLAAGVIAGVAISGPVGWIIGGLISALFAILPGVIGDTKEPPNRANVEQILQFKMFGDAKHTGNEKCREDTSDYKGNPDCQALYGAGTLSMALQMTNFDAVLFLSQFNDGYPMTIPDIAKNFYVIDDRKHDGKDKMAIIDCNMGRGDGYFQCLTPSFKLNRELFNIPGISDTADKVFDQIAPKGDCKLITFPGDAYFASIDLKLNGLPSSIACGVPDTLNDGTVVPADVVQNPDNGFARAPEPAVPFANLAQERYACLFHGGDGPFCLPPGTYHKQSGVGFEIVDVDSLTLPNEGNDGAWSLQVHYKTIKSGHTQQTIDRNHGHNEDPNRKSSDWQLFSNDMHILNQENDPGENYFTIIGPEDGPDPVCCLFSEPSFGGNVWCAGVGGGDVPADWKDISQSVSCHAGAQAYVYADHYNDLGGALITHNVEDLTGQLYDNNSKSFSKNLKAMWIFKP